MRRERRVFDNRFWRNDNPTRLQLSRRSTLNVGSWFRQERKIIRRISPQGDIQKEQSDAYGLKKFGAEPAVAALSLAGATLATPPARKRSTFHRGWGGGWAGPAIVGGLALGALARRVAAVLWLRLRAGLLRRVGDGYYGGDCVFRRRVTTPRTALSCAHVRDRY